MSRCPAAAPAQRRLRCAIYTRKSTDEGLDQNFNSLDAQREACAAYVASQRHEGWVLLPAAYDDGGFSGGTMQRPGLARLLADVGAGLVDIVVVYKVDRLTRALADFAKIVEIFDASAVCFVSVTQAFNTTTSMGRLTLNVLLSFAQFEREVTAERIRDKIAASKKKGLWMGGLPPLGYDVDERKLVVNEPEAETVRHIFQRYAALGSVRVLKEELDAAGIVSKPRRDRHGRKTGGVPFSRGALYLLLQNPVYIGDVAHKSARYPGVHDTIVARELWDRVQGMLAANRTNGSRMPGTSKQSFLAGLLHGPDGLRMTASHAVKRLAGAGRITRKRYRYYVAAQSGNGTSGQAPLRVSAAELERAALTLLAEALRDHAILAPVLGPATRSAAVLEQLLGRLAETGRSIASSLGSTEAEGTAKPSRDVFCRLVERIDLASESLTLTLSANALLDHAGVGDPGSHVDVDAYTGSPCKVVCSRPFRLPQNGRPVRLLLGNEAAPPPRRDPVLIALVANARRWGAMLLADPALTVDDIIRREGLGKGVVSRALPLAFLAPDIAGAILEGRQPEGLSAGALRRLTDLPRDWDAQRRMFGVPTGCRLADGGQALASTQPDWRASRRS